MFQNLDSGPEIIKVTVESLLVSLPVRVVTAPRVVEANKNVPCCPFELVSNGLDFLEYPDAVAIAALGLEVVKRF